MVKTMSQVLDGMPLELDRYNRPSIVGPCLSNSVQRKCGTAEKVGYSCYGCIGAKFPTPKPLFRQATYQLPAKFDDILSSPAGLSPPAAGVPETFTPSGVRRAG